MILGDDEQNNGTVSFMDPNREQNTDIPLEEFISNLTNEIKSKK
jgi:threonyl-tRNA synthetase